MFSYDKLEKVFANHERKQGRSIPDLHELIRGVVVCLRDMGDELRPEVDGEPEGHTLFIPTDADIKD